LRLFFHRIKRTPSSNDTTRRHLCQLRHACPPLAGQGIFASYHTHGSYANAYDNEVSSTIDLVSDFDYGIDGYVSTPGGRVWLVDFQTFSTRQVCGMGCVAQVPNFVPNTSDTIQNAYTLR
jgi:hypothetical protein